MGSISTAVRSVSPSVISLYLQIISLHSVQQESASASVMCLAEACLVVTALFSFC